MSAPYGYGAEDEDDVGYSTLYPNRYGGFHRTIWSPYYRDRFSFDSDPYDDYVYGSGHYTSPYGDSMDFDPGWGGG